MTATVHPIGIARSMAVHPSSVRMPECDALKLRLVAMTADERDDILWALARAHPRIVEAMCDRYERSGA